MECTCKTHFYGNIKHLWQLLLYIVCGMEERCYFETGGLIQTPPFKSFRQTTAAAISLKSWIMHTESVKMQGGWIGGKDLDRGGGAMEIGVSSRTNSTKVQNR